ncbi:hypothetical protein GCM10023185_14890 [Hymenobacter saemangeumensis]|uniref:Uncharacterized protein n=1 Tax=Hymenobacter saemangeumensis TaxID=1084522 RepID=A0ABP8I9G4_9BACT
MTSSRFFAALLLAFPLGALAQASTSDTATPPPPGAVVTETTEDLDPATGKVVRRTTRTYTMPGGTAATPSVAGRATTPAAVPSGTTSRPAPAPASEAADVRATDAQISTFLGRKTAVANMTAPALLDAYGRFMDKVRSTRQGWRPSDWALAGSVLASLNARYEQLRPNMSFDDKLTIRTQQAEFHALRTGRQISDQVSDKL